MKVLEEGKGRLFTDPDPDKAREFFRNKSRKLENKLMPLKTAIEKFVHDGEYLAIGGFGANRTPIAACHEILRQGRKHMGFAGHTSTHDFQILCAGEVFDKCDIAYIIGLEARGLSNCARKYMQSGKVEICEWTNYALAARLRAAAAGVRHVARDANVRVLRRHSLRARSRVVRAPVVHDHKFPRSAEAREGLADSPGRLRDVLGLVEHRGDDRQVHGIRHVRSPASALPALF